VLVPLNFRYIELPVLRPTGNSRRPQQHTRWSADRI